MRGFNLVLLAATLSAVALAAPRQAEEFSLMETRSAAAVDSLSRSFSQLKADVTMGKTTGVAETIATLITMVSEQIEPAINDAHAVDQRLLNAVHAALTSANNDYASQRSVLLTQAEEIRKSQTAFNTLVDDWRTSAAQYTVAKTLYETTHDQKEDICCQMKVAGVEDLVYTPSFYKCDFTDDAKADACVSRAATDITGYTENHFGAGKAKYDGLFTHCSELAISTNTNMNGFLKQDVACDTLKSRSQMKETEINSDHSSFITEWTASNQAFDGAWTTASGAFTSQQAATKNTEVDRKNEWQATQMIKCMLQAYQIDGTFTASAETACNTHMSVIHITNTYEASPAKADQSLPDWVVLQSYSTIETVCDQNAVINLPDCATPTVKAVPQCENHNMLVK